MRHFINLFQEREKKVICKIRLSIEMSICIDVSNENLFIEIPRKRNFFLHKNSYYVT